MSDADACYQCGATGVSLLVYDDPDGSPSSGRQRYCARCMIGRRLRVFWPLDEQWYVGVVQQYDEESGEHLLEYSDGDTEWVKIGENAPSGGGGASASGGPSAGPGPGQGSGPGEGPQGMGRPGGVGGPPHENGMGPMGHQQPAPMMGHPQHPGPIQTNGSGGGSPGRQQQQQHPQQHPQQQGLQTPMGGPPGPYGDDPRRDQPPQQQQQQQPPPGSWGPQGPLQVPPGQDQQQLPQQQPPPMQQPPHGPPPPQGGPMPDQGQSQGQGNMVPGAPPPGAMHAPPPMPYGMYPPPHMPYGPHPGMPPHPYGSPYPGAPPQGGPYPPPPYGYPPHGMMPGAGPPGVGGKRGPGALTPDNPHAHHHHHPGDGGKRKSGPKTWTKEEDQILLNLVQSMRMPMKWSVVAQSMPDRTGKQCRERYVNHLNPRLKSSDWNPQEDATIFHLYNTNGSQWAKMSKMIPGRTDNGIKNRFHNLRRQLEREDEHRLRLSKPKDFPDEIRQERLREFPDHLKGKAHELWDMNHGIGVVAALSVLGGGARGNAGKFGPFRRAEPSGEQCARCGLFAPSAHTGAEVCSKTKWCQACTRISPHLSGNLLRECLNLRKSPDDKKQRVIEAWDVAAKKKEKGQDGEGPASEGGGAKFKKEEGATPSMGGVEAEM